MPDILEAMESQLEGQPGRLEQFAFQEAKYYLWRPWGWTGVCRFFLPNEATSTPAENLVRDFRPVYDALESRLEKINSFGGYNFHTYQVKAASKMQQRMVPKSSAEQILPMYLPLMDSNEFLRRYPEKYAKGKARHGESFGCVSPEEFASGILYGRRNRSGLLVDSEDKETFFELNRKARNGELRTLHTAVERGWIDLLREYTDRIQLEAQGRIVDADDPEVVASEPQSIEVMLEVQERANWWGKQDFGGLGRIIADAYRIDPDMVSDALKQLLNCERLGSNAANASYGDDGLVALIAKERGIKKKTARAQLKQQIPAIVEAIRGKERTKIPQ